MVILSNTLQLADEPLKKIEVVSMQSAPVDKDSYGNSIVHTMPYGGNHGGLRLISTCPVDTSLTLIQSAFGSQNIYKQAVYFAEIKPTSQTIRLLRVFELMKQKRWIEAKILWIANLMKEEQLDLFGGLSERFLNNGEAPKNVPTNAYMTKKCVSLETGKLEYFYRCTGDTVSKRQIDQRLPLILVINVTGISTINEKTSLQNKDLPEEINFPKGNQITKQRYRLMGVSFCSGIDHIADVRSKMLKILAGISTMGCKKPTKQGQWQLEAVITTLPLWSDEWAGLNGAWQNRCFLKAKEMPQWDDSKWKAIITSWRGHYLQENYQVKWGEIGLEASSIRRNQEVEFNTRRRPEQRTDAILSLRSHFGQELLVSEVSGPPYENDLEHFGDDKIKIQKGLKDILNLVAKRCERGNSDIFQKLKVFGIQVFGWKVYIYAMDIPHKHLYRFKQVATFWIPQSPADLLWMPDTIHILLYLKLWVNQALENLEELSRSSMRFSLEGNQRLLLRPWDISPTLWTRHRNPRRSSTLRLRIYSRYAAAIMICAPVENMTASAPKAKQGIKNANIQAAFSPPTENAN
ncbi:hypothetical protein G9A89_000618 [Geosiphon pyriformis]|nr:hypothetical protein G9A89_000618 [Geosiphon pyriformis]